MTTWHITTYDHLLEPQAVGTFEGSHSQAVIEAERMIGYEPQWSYQIRETAQEAVLEEVRAERGRQNDKWGQQNHEDGTGPDHGLLGTRMATLRDDARERTDWLGERGIVSWSDILLEEVFEALAEDDAVALRTELIQVAAVATQWVEAIDRRGTVE